MLNGRGDGFKLGGSMVILVRASNTQARLQNTSAHLGKHHSTRLWTPTRASRPHGPRVTCKMTAHIGAGVACSAGPFWRPATAPRRFLALPHCPNRDAPLPDHARARRRPPSPAPNHPTTAREHKQSHVKKAPGRRLRVGSVAQGVVEAGSSASRARARQNSLPPPHLSSLRKAHAG